ncbi:MAG TPA: hypothetical protein VJ723_02140, partial [Candidatus Angelobacter sp.]|nr:hypothetical protein [Candidatus Angelobacter sp.]
DLCVPERPSRCGFTQATITNPRSVRVSPFGPSRRFRHLRYFRFGWERTLVNRMPDECKIGIEVNPKVVLGKPIIRGTSRYPARARSGAS